MKAQQIYQEAFSTSRDPRSTPYKRGVLDTLKYRLGEIDTLRSPYTVGSTEFDAWKAGSNEGHHLARDYLGEGIYRLSANTGA